MGILGTVLLGVGAIISLVCGIMLIIKAFQKSVLWGIGFLLVPFVNLVFVFKNWEETKKPFLYSCLAGVLVVAGSVLSGMGAANDMSMPAPQVETTQVSQ